MSKSLCEILSHYPSQEKQEIQSLIGYSLIQELESLSQELESLKAITSDELKIPTLLNYNDFNHSMIKQRIHNSIQELQKMMKGNLCFENPQDKSIYKFLQNEKIQPEEKYEGCQDRRDLISFDSESMELAQPVIEGIRTLLLKERASLYTQIQNQRDILDKREDSPTFSDLKSFSYKLDNQIRELSKKQELEVLLSSSGPFSNVGKERNVISSNQRSTTSAPSVLSSKNSREEEEDISELFKEFALLDKPIELPITRPNSVLLTAKPPAIKSMESKPFGMRPSMIVKPPQFLKKNTSPRKQKLVGPFVQTAQIIL